jgi:hypothetical protein
MSFRNKVLAKYGDWNKKPLQFFSDCVGWPRQYIDALHYLIDNGEDVERDDFLKHIDFQSLVYDEDKTPNDVLPASDWGISYHKVEGFNCYYFVHSAIEHVFADEDEIKKIQQKAETE